MAKLEHGIQKNLINTHSSERGGVGLPKFDPRTTAEVEKSRGPNNGKLFRTKQQRAEAHWKAEKQKMGHWKGTYICDSVAKSQRSAA